MQRSNLNKDTKLNTQLLNQTKKIMYELEETTPKKTETNYFGQWIKSIPVGDYPDVKKKVISDCKITGQIFSHWKCGNSKVPILAHEKINLIAGYDIFSVESNPYEIYEYIDIQTMEPTGIKFQNLQDAIDHAKQATYIGYIVYNPHRSIVCKFSNKTLTLV